MCTASVAGSGQVNRCASHDGSVANGGVARWMVSSRLPSAWRIRGMLGDIQARGWILAHRLEELMAGPRRRLRDGWRRRSGRRRRAAEVGGGVGRGVNAPTAGPGSGCRRAARCRSRRGAAPVDLAAVSAGSPSRRRGARPTAAVLGARGQRMQLPAGIVDDRPVGDHHPPAGGDRGLVGVRGRDHRLFGRRQKPSRARAKSGMAGGVVVSGGDPGGLRLAASTSDRDRIGLRQDHQRLAVADGLGQMRERRLDRRAPRGRR